jgi:ABC-type polysaccharide/polyol phosphate transport system ATPase subunit
VDEILAVGDAQFHEKCLKRVEQMRKGRMTMLCASHSPQMVNTFCERAIWLHQGQVVLDGPAVSVTAAYARFVATPGSTLPSQNMRVVEAAGTAR